jgi:muramoyltetrapeptide carboxypeptidase
MAIDASALQAGVAVLSRHYKVVFDETVHSTHRYLAGDDERRLSELNRAFTDPEVRAIFCARGGYGATRLLSRLRVDSLPHKALVGFSDITALHALMQRAHRVSIHGPVATQLGRMEQGMVDRLFDVLEHSRPPEPLAGARPLMPGLADGPLLGGNLSVFSHLLGTPYLPPLDGAVLCLEDVGERPYRLDRLWTHLRLAGVFDRIAGIALGAFASCDEQNASYTGDDVLGELARETGKPCAIGFPVGHRDRNAAVPFGVRVRLDAGAGRLEFLEAAVAPRT